MQSEIRSFGLFEFHECTNQSTTNLHHLRVASNGGVPVMTPVILASTAIGMGAAARFIPDEIVPKYVVQQEQELNGPQVG